MEEVYILIRTLVVARRASRDVGRLRAGKEARKEEEMKRKVRRDGGSRWVNSLLHNLRWAVK